MSYKDKISVFVITGSPKGACSIIRLLGPLKYLVRENLVELTSLFWNREYTDTDLNHLEDRWNLADIIIFQRHIPLDGMFSIHKVAEKCKKIFIYEIDDNLMESPQTHPRFFWHLAHKKIIQAIISKSDAITTTTPILAEYLKQLNPSVYVLPNFIDPELFLQDGNPERNKSGKIILGFVGTPTHLPDFHIIVPTIKRILEEFDGKVLFRCIGFCPDELRNFSNVEYFAETDYREYAKNLGKAGFDIGLGPLEDNLFNRCKSNIKFLEYGICDIPGIWSNVPPYTESVTDRRNGILVKEHNNEAWYKAIKLLIVNEGLRKRLSLNVKKTVLDKFLLPKHADKWYELYKSLIKKNKKLQANKNDDQEIFRKLFMMREGNYKASIRKYVDEAEKEYERVLKKPEAVLSIERAITLEKHKDQKINNLEGLIFITYVLGSSYKRQGAFKKAEEHFKRTIDLIDLSDEQLLVESDKYRGGSHFHLGCICKELGEKEEAKHHFKKCLKIIPDHKRAGELLGALDNE